MGIYEDLKGKRVLVTGASHGIGKAVAKAFAEAGARVFLNYRTDPELAKKAVAEMPGEVHLFRADIADREQRDAMFDEIRKVFGGLDCAVNNAGWNHPSVPLDQLDEELYYRLTDINIKGTLFCCLSEIALMRGHGGSIINIGSVHQDTSVPGRTFYSASKGAIHSMTGQLLLEVGDENIRLNNVVPGYISIKPEVQTGPQTGIPLLRFGKVEDVAALCLFLGSEDASFINGADLVIDGGVSRKLARILFDPIGKKSLS